jgi:hypothetical protein
LLSLIYFYKSIITSNLLSNILQKIYHVKQILMKKLVHFFLLSTISIAMFAQNVGINATGAAPAPSAGLDVNFTDKGILIPNVALTALNLAGPITSPATSLLVYNTVTANTGVAAPPNNISPGYYYWNSTNWVRVVGSNTNDWTTLGNASTLASTNFLGTTDANDLILKTAGSAATNERLRIIGAGATPGQVVINNTGIFAGDAFSVYANNSNNGTYYIY